MALRTEPLFALTVGAGGYSPHRSSDERYRQNYNCDDHYEDCAKEVM
jgi:hypothetical protein